MDWPRPKRIRGGLEGEVVYVDRFGNAITNLDAGNLRKAAKPSVCAIIAEKWICPLVTHYEAVPAGATAAIIGSSGFLEISINGDSAAAQFGVRVGDPVSVLRTEHKAACKSP